MTNPTTFWIMYAIFYLFTMAYAAFAYVGVSLGGSRMARKVGMNHPWMFWVPGANVYAMGKLADTQASLCEGKTTKFRKKLLVWTIILASAAVIWAIVMTVIVAMAAVNGMLDDSGNVTISDASGDTAIVGYLLALLISSLLLIVPFIIYLVVYYKSLYRIYKLYAPGGAVGFTVLSFFAEPAIPILFLILSGKDPVLPLQGTDEDTATDGDAPVYSL